MAELRAAELRARARVHWPSRRHRATTSAASSPVRKDPRSTNLPPRKTCTRNLFEEVFVTQLKPDSVGGLFQDEVLGLILHLF